jgi:hypothetical protein
METYLFHHTLIHQKLLILPGKQKDACKSMENFLLSLLLLPLGKQYVLIWYMLHGKDRTEIDFMCLSTMIDPASSWFKIVELPVVELTPTSHSKIRAKPHDKTKEAYFDKSSSMALCDSYGIKRKPTSIKNP